MTESSLEQWKLQCLRDVARHRATLYHLTHVDNLPGIASAGLEPYRTVHSRARHISLGSAQDRRAERRIAFGPNRWKTIHDAVPFYFTPRTPMSYRCIQDSPLDLCFLEVRLRHLCADRFQVAFSDGNMASARSTAWYSFNYIDEIPWDVIDAPRWDVGSLDAQRIKRQRCAEFLVEGNVPWSLVGAIVVRTDRMKARLEANPWCDTPVRVDPWHFFDGEQVEEVVDVPDDQLCVLCEREFRPRQRTSIRLVAGEAHRIHEGCIGMLR